LKQSVVLFQMLFHPLGTIIQQRKCTNTSQDLTIVVQHQFT